MVFIYILELENKKYYIGKTTNPKNNILIILDHNGQKNINLKKC